MINKLSSPSYCRCNKFLEVSGWPLVLRNLDNSVKMKWKLINFDC